MFKSVLTIAILLLSFSAVMAQSAYLQFSYDTRGNNIGRQISMSAQQRKGNATVIDTNAITDKIGDVKIQIYHNPVLEVVTVKVFSTAPTESFVGKVQVYNILGNSIGEATIVDGVGNFNFQHQPAGSYILKISYLNKTTTWKVLKQ